MAGIVLLLYLPVMLLPSNFFAGKVQKFIHQVVENKGKAAQLLTDTFRGIKLVKASVIEEYRLEKLKKVNQDTVSVWAKVVVLLTYLPFLFDVVRKAAGTNFKFKKQLAEYDKLFELIVMEDERSGEEEKKPFLMEKGITVDKVSFRYDKELPMILNNISLHIKKGEWIGIVGITS